MDCVAQGTFEEDLSVFAKIGLDFIEDARILDIGCFDGQNTVLKFASHPSVSHVVGIDVCEEAIKRARENYADGSFSFLLFDVCIGSPERLLALLDENGIGGLFDVVYFANSLQHMADRRKALALAQEMLKPGGYVVIRTVDDDLKVSYPDEEGRMRKALAFYDENVRRAVPWTRWTDRYYGKKCPGELLQAGFANPNMQVFMSSTVGKPLDERELFFDRCTYFRKGTEQLVGAQTVRKAERLLSEWKELLQDEAYCFGSATVMVWARKPLEGCGEHVGLRAEEDLRMKLAALLPNRGVGFHGNPEYRICRMEEADLRQVLHIEMVAFPSPWSPAAYIAELQHNPRSLFLTAKAGSGELLGYVGVWLCGDEAWIVKVAVAEKFRRKGVASGLVEAACFCAERAGCKRVVLEFRVGNSAAREFYRAAGFAEKALLAGYYQNPDEDAAVWEKALPAHAHEDTERCTV